MIGAQPFAHALESERQRQFFEFRVDRRRRRELLTNARQRRIGVFAQALGVGLLALRRAAQQGTRVAEVSAVEARTTLEIAQLEIEIAGNGVGLFDLGPGVAHLGKLLVGAYPSTQLGLFTTLLRHHVFVEQRIELLATNFDAVLETRERVFDDASCRIARLGELNVAPAQFVAAEQGGWQVALAQLLQLRHGEQAIGGTGVSGDEHELPGLRAGKVHLQMLRRLHRFAVFVGAQQPHIEAPAGKLKIIRVAPEGGDTGLGCEHQADVGVALVLVQEILSAVVERDALAFVARGFFAALFELGEGLLARVVGGAVVETASRGLDFRRDVIHRHQDVGHLRRAFDFGVAIACDKAIFEQAFFFVRVFCETGGDAVVVGEDQALTRDE